MSCVAARPYVRPPRATSCARTRSTVAECHRDAGVAPLRTRESEHAPSTTTSAQSLSLSLSLSLSQAAIKSTHGTMLGDEMRMVAWLRHDLHLELRVLALERLERTRDPLAGSRACASNTISTRATPLHTTPTSRTRTERLGSSHQTGTPAPAACAAATHRASTWRRRAASETTTTRALSTQEEIPQGSISLLPIHYQSIKPIHGDLVTL